MAGRKLSCMAYVKRDGQLDLCTRKAKFIVRCEASKAKARRPFGRTGRAACGQHLAIFTRVLTHNVLGSTIVAHVEVLR